MCIRDRPTTTRSKWFEVILRPIVSALDDRLPSVWVLSAVAAYTAMRTCAANAMRITSPVARVAMIKARVFTSAESTVLTASDT